VNDSEQITHLVVEVFICLLVSDANIQQQILFANILSRKIKKIIKEPKKRERTP
jgi:hypothetical protein